MLISGFEKLTLVNYPGVLACIIFTNGCNYRCPFCQNSGLVVNNDTHYYSEEEILEYLDKRISIMDGICISGGEPTVQKGLIDFIKKVKEKGIKVKLDTNGSNPKVLKELLDQKLLDYVAMDIKNVFNKYQETTNSKVVIDDIRKSMRMIKNAGITYEFRTTVVKEFHTYNNLLDIAKLLKGEPYYLQQFEDSENVISKGLHSYSDEELRQMYTKLKKRFSNIYIRGIR